MDRAEIFGFGAALGVHGLLLGVFALGLMASAETAPKPESISVSLVGEIDDVSSAPDAIQEESAPPAAGETAAAEPPPAPSPVMQIEKPQTKPVPKPAKAETAPSVAKAAPKPLKTAAAAPPKTTKTAPAKPSGLSRSFEDSINTIGKAPGAGKAVGAPAAKTAAEVRRSVNTTLGSQIKPYLRSCAQRGVDVEKIETFVTLSLDSVGRLTGVTYNRQAEVNDSNRPQAGVLKDCILQAVRAASPYEGLDPEYHDVWKTHKLRLRATG